MLFLIQHICPLSNIFPTSAALDVGIRHTAKSSSPIDETHYYKTFMLYVLSTLKGGYKRERDQGWK